MNLKKVSPLSRHSPPGTPLNDKLRPLSKWERGDLQVCGLVSRVWTSIQSPLVPSAGRPCAVHNLPSCMWCPWFVLRSWVPPEWLDSQNALPFGVNNDFQQHQAGILPVFQPPQQESTLFLIKQQEIICEWMTRLRHGPFPGGGEGGRSCCRAPYVNPLDWESSKWNWGAITRKRVNYSGQENTPMVPYLVLAAPIPPIPPIHGVRPLPVVPLVFAVFLSYQKTDSPQCCSHAWQTRQSWISIRHRSSSFWIYCASKLSTAPIFNQEGITQWQGIMVFFYNRLV